MVIYSDEITTDEEPEVIRIFGDTRYETGYKVAKELKEELGLEKIEAVVVATGKNFADALAGSYLAVKKNAPIILTNGKSDNIAQLHEYIKTNVVSGGTVYILGGDGAIGAKIEAELSNYGDITRVSGNTRYETSVAVAKTFFEDAEEVIIASGKNFPDGLCGGPLAAAIDAPLILTTDGKTEAARDYVQEEEIAKGYVLGGTSALGDAAVIDIFGLRSED